MKKLYSLLLLVAASASAQIVNIPDANFKDALISLGVDTSGDGEIQFSEAEAMAFSLNLEGRNISDLTGIEAFANLFGLEVQDNNLTSLDVSPLIVLGHLNVSNNPLTQLTLTGSPVGQLLMDNTQLQNLDLTGLNSLGDVWVTNNSQLESITANDMEGMFVLTANNNPMLKTLIVRNASVAEQIAFENCPMLEEVDMSGAAQLTSVPLTAGAYPNMRSMNFGGCSALDLLWVQMPLGSTTLESLNVEGCTSLGSLVISNASLVDFVLPDLPSLWALDIVNSVSGIFAFSSPIMLEGLIFSGNNVSQLDLSYVGVNSLGLYDNIGLEYVILKNGHIDEADIQGNDDLLHICTDDGETDAIQIAAGPDIVVNSFCSFVPGSTYNTISGKVRYDLDGDGCDEDDFPAQFVKVILDGTQTRTTYSNQNGEYIFYTGAGNYTVTPFVENTGDVSVTPMSQTFNFTDTGNIQNGDFCITPVGNNPDLEVAIVPLIPARPGFEAQYKIVYRNIGNQVMSQTNGITFNFDDELLELVSASQTPDVQSFGSMSWSYPNLVPFETRSITLTFDVNSPTDTPPVNIGDELNFGAVIEPVAGDINQANNQFGLKQTVVGSFDPNNKTCLEGDVVSASQIGEELHYNINFENTGTFAAENVVVADIINPEMYDLSTLQIMDASHAVYVRMTGNNVEFIFEGINLEIGGHGNILLKVKSLGTLAAGDSVANDANIYFDYNFPVLTDPALTLFESLKVVEVSGVAMNVWPNPSTGIINLKSVSAITKMELYDVQGRLLMIKSGNSPEEAIDLSNRATGIYMLRVTTAQGVGNVRIIRE